MGVATALAIFALALGAAQARATAIAGSAVLRFDTELTSMHLTGGPFPMRLAAGWEFVDSNVAITSSSQRAANPGPGSLGQAIASEGAGAGLQAGAGLGQVEPIDPNALHGQQFHVSSFFDVFFEKT